MSKTKNTERGTATNIARRLQEEYRGLDVRVDATLDDLQDELRSVLSCLSRVEDLAFDLENLNVIGTGDVERLLDVIGETRRAI